MPETRSHPHGTPSWVDLGASDVDSEVRFYGELFGWTSPPGDEQFGGYRMFLQGEHTVAGAGRKQDPSIPTLWTVYIATDDADATAQAVRDAGGQVVMAPLDVGTNGRMAIFSDPTGATFGVWQPGEHAGATLVNEPVSFAWAHLMSPDTDRAAAFYRQVFGWEASPSEAGTIAFTLPGRDDPVAGMSPTDQQAGWGASFSVPDADAVAARAQELGGRVLMPIEDTPWGRMGALSDPEGAMFGVAAAGQG